MLKSKLTTFEVSRKTQSATSLLFIYFWLRTFSHGFSFRLLGAHSSKMANLATSFLTHQQRVLRLYKQAYRHTESWIGTER